MRRYIQYPIILILILIGFYFYYRQDQTERMQNVRKIGEQSSQLLLKTLKTQLSTKISEEGLVSAIEFCNREAMVLTDSVQSVIGRGILLKRTSVRTRNPVNQPDAEEIKALNQFIGQQDKAETMPAYYVSQSKINGKLYYHYFRPLLVQGLCLNCHGETSKMNPDVYAKIKKLYPDDKATGYKDGDFRGLVHVTIPASAIRTD